MLTFTTQQLDVFNFSLPPPLYAEMIKTLLTHTHNTILMA